MPPPNYIKLLKILNILDKNEKIPGEIRKNQKGTTALGGEPTTHLGNSIARTDKGIKALQENRSGGS